MECKGFLFDLDGTLVDSLPAVERAWTHWAERRGVNPQAVLDFIHGKQAITSLRHFMPGESEAEIQREFQLLEQREAQDTDGVRALPGAIALLDRLNALDIPWAIVTSGSVPVAGARRQAGGLPQPVGRRLIDRQVIAAEHLDELHRILAPERLVRRHPGGRFLITLVLVRLALHRKQIRRVVGEPQP